MENEEEIFEQINLFIISLSNAVAFHVFGHIKIGEF